MLSFAPAAGGAYEIMFVEIKNTSKKAIEFTATSAIPLYGRSADNLRDHRHVTSLLNRVVREKFGVSLCPTMSFNERGHLVNSISYYVIGADDAGRPPAGVFATIESFAGRSGDLERPESLVLGTKTENAFIGRVGPRQRSDGRAAIPTGAFETGRDHKFHSDYRRRPRTV